MPHESEKTSRRDARGALERALEDTRRRAEAIRRGSGLFASTRLAAEIEALREHAEAAGLLREFPLLREAPDAFGFEHQVWFSRDEGEAARVLKATYENSFGCLPGQGESLPCQYLERLVLQNQIFGDDLILEGVEEVRPGVYRVITSQPAVEGRFASAGEVREYFSAHDFEPVSGGDCKLWLHRDGDVVCGDTHGGNILVTKTGALVAIDVPVMRRLDFPGELRPC